MLGVPVLAWWPVVQTFTFHLFVTKANVSHINYNKNWCKKPTWIALFFGLYQFNLFIVFKFCDLNVEMYHLEIWSSVIVFFFSFFFRPVCFCFMVVVLSYVNTSVIRRRFFADKALYSITECSRQQTKFKSIITFKIKPKFKIILDLCNSSYWGNASVKTNFWRTIFHFVLNMCWLFFRGQ